MSKRNTKTSSPARISAVAFMSGSFHAPAASASTPAVSSIDNAIAERDAARARRRHELEEAAIRIQFRLEQAINRRAADAYAKTIRDYLVDGKLPGDFTCSILCNNLSTALAYAKISKELTLTELADLAEILHGGMPRDAMGSLENIDSWCCIRRREMPAR